MRISSAAPRIIGFTCNWGAYSALDMAGVRKESYPAAISLVRLPCLSRLNTGLVLKTFELGAGGVLLLGCPPDQCNFKSGTDHAWNVYSESGQVLGLLGIDRRRLGLIEAPVGEGTLIADKITRFVTQVTECLAEA